jgi:hypothetical protein
MSEHEGMLTDLQQAAFQYFVKEVNPDNGLVADSTRGGAPSSIAAVGLGLTAYVVGVERGFVTREEGVGRTLATLRFFQGSPQGRQPDATGYQGFYYHFLDMQSGLRFPRSELSTVDTALLLAGALAAAEYYDGEADGEREIRELARSLYERADWRWALNGGRAVAHGWTPERGFLRHRWHGYNEALLLYVLGLGSPTHPLPEESYPAWTSTYKWKKLYGYEFLYAGPLFIHQLSHIWVDFRGIQDEYMRSRGLDYFENSRRATHVQQRYAIRNPKGFEGYGECLWGITASEGPGPARRKVNGRERRFFGYRARSIPYGPDDGTLAPWAVTASLPFAPEIVLPTLRHIDSTYPEMTNSYGLKCSFNPTFPERRTGKAGWISHVYFGLDQGPVVSMIENHRSGLIWRLMRDCPYIVTGLRRAGFTGGWL